jgi:hypothetical protein
VAANQRSTSGVLERGRMTSVGSPGSGEHFGHRVVVLTRTNDLGRFRMRTAEVLVAVLAGEVEILRGARETRGLKIGQVAVVPRGEVWTLTAPERARLLVVVHPPGPEAVLAAICGDPPLSPQALVSLAVEEGVELLL